MTAHTLFAHFTDVRESKSIMNREKILRLHCFNVGFRLTIIQECDIIPLPSRRPNHDPQMTYSLLRSPLNTESSHKKHSYLCQLFKSLSRAVAPSHSSGHAHNRSRFNGCLLKGSSPSNFRTTHLYQRTFQTVAKCFRRKGNLKSPF